VAGVRAANRWLLPDPLPANPAAPADLPALAAGLLARRGLVTAEAVTAFLEPSASRLNRPDDLPDIQPATDRLVRAVKAGEKVVVCGDYDADGVTATALLVIVLRNLGLDPGWYVPHRVTEGYGLSVAGVEHARSVGAGLIVTTDCGTSDHAAAAAARAGGIDLVITDHHELRTPDAPLPDALAVVNPHRPDAAPAFRHLAGVGVAFKLAWSVLARLGRPREELTGLIDLVTIGTIADVVPLVEENRVIARLGLTAIRQSSRPGVRALLEAAGTAGRALTARDVGFALAPRINAAGRVSHAGRAIELLLTDDPVEASSIAAELNRHNRGRQAIEERVLVEALSLIDRDRLAAGRTLVVAGTDWPEGIIGIVASRLADRFFRPTIVVSLRAGQGRGSGRSIPAFDLHAALEACADKLEGFGGHRSAAGVTIAADRVAEFRDCFERQAESLPIDAFEPTLDIDALARLEEVDDDLLDSLDRFEPFGEGNPRPVLASFGLEVVGYPRRVGRGHLRLNLREGNAVREAIAWGRSDDILDLRVGEPEHLDVCYSPMRRTWQGRMSLQLEVLDLRTAERR
jgi:single-stranded-DNA-specific exonuclease